MLTVQSYLSWHFLIQTVHMEFWRGFPEILKCQYTKYRNHSIKTQERGLLIMNSMVLQYFGFGLQMCFCAHGRVNLISVANTFKLLHGFSQDHVTDLYNCCTILERGMVSLCALFMLPGALKHMWKWKHCTVIL